MEPLGSSKMITEVVSYLGRKLSKENSLNNFFSDFTEATVDWIRPLFLKDDGSEKEFIQNLKENPKSSARKKAVESLLDIGIEENPAAINYIQEIYDKISKLEEGGKVVNNIINSKNVNTGNVNTGGGDFHIGDSK